MKGCALVAEQLLLQISMFLINATIVTLHAVQSQHFEMIHGVSERLYLQWEAVKPNTVFLALSR